jgi:N-acylneuraminate cytidylyltransferase
MNYIALICARGGSKGIPKKNIKIFNGKPLIKWSIEIAKKIPRIKEIIVSTDNNEIAEIAKKSGANVPFVRPSILSQDNSDEWLVWKHAVNFMVEKNYKFENLITLPPTSPLRTVKNINECLDKYEKNNFDAIITVSNPHRNPYFNMVRVTENDNVEILIKENQPIIRRQDAPRVFDILTVCYVTSFKYIIENNNLFSGNVGYVNINKMNGIDIDTFYDFEIAEFLSKKKKI